MTLSAAVHTYFQALWGYDPNTDHEHTYRTPLENFLNAVCNDLNFDVKPRP